MLRNRGCDDADDAGVVLLAGGGVAEGLIGDGEFSGARRRHFLELLPQVDHLVGMVAGNLSSKRLLDGVGVGGGFDAQQVVVILQGMPFLNSVTLVMAGGNSRVTFRSRKRRSLRASVPRAQ